MGYVGGYSGNVFKSLPQTQIFQSIYLCSQMEYNLLYFKLIFFYLTKSQFEISKLYDVGQQRYGDQKIKVSGRDLIHLIIISNILTSYPMVPSLEQSREGRQISAENTMMTRMPQTAIDFVGRLRNGYITTQYLNIKYFKILTRFGIYKDIQT